MSKPVVPKDIFFYIPNLVGYGRVASALISFFFMDHHPVYFTVLYSVSCLLDACDGYAARKYNQSSKFGAVLDMVTDRCTTTSLLCYLCKIYPSFTIIFQILVSLDLASHYMHMYATLQSGGNSHKHVTKQSSWLLNLYYTNKNVLFTACLFNELFFLALYLISFDSFPRIFGIQFGVFLAYFTLPLWAFKQFTNVVQMNRAAVMLAKIDCDEKNEPFEENRTLISS